ncbi:uncharacterized protein M6B38_197545 [Iris pallida]|nr:uncharacterized protein M6B38_197545 [Iris pallida]
MEEKDSRAEATVQEREVPSDSRSSGGMGSVKPDARVRSYSRSEMEELRFADQRGQRRIWDDAYRQLGPDVAKEFDGLRAAGRRQQQQKKKNQEPPAWKKQDASKSEMCSAVCSVGLEACDDTLTCGGVDVDVDESLEAHEAVDEDEDDSSSDEYGSIQRPAFFVEGEPDFESGPPLDGLEYLRRVRWEAAKIPKVKVVKLQPSKIISEQTPYMPQIPEIVKCPQNLLPSKQWEDTFLADFSELRQAISLLDESCSEQSESVIKVGKDVCCKQVECTQEPPEKKNPTVPSILSMDILSRAAALRKRISSLESASSLSRDDCLWLFSLCAAVDTPLGAETCASLRCLLRKCSSLLALKSEQDDEVAMLSILITIAGKYFRQSDNNT